MAITPYSTPVQYQYKPLNLMAFAEPLMKMQEKYDLTKAALDEADVKATSLQFANDPERARALENIYRTKRDELVQTLLETSNYTQVASKLKQLNKLWTEDPERLALEANYKTFAERDKEELARIGVGEGKITKEEYLQWRADEIRKFKEAKGTNFRPDKEAPGGTTYNVVTGTVGRTANMQKDYDDTAYKAASAIKAKKWDSALRAMGVEPTVEDMKYMQQHFEKLSPEEIAGAVEQYMRGLDRFKPWLEEKAAYDFKDYLYANDEGASYNTLAKSLLNKGITTIDRDLEKIAKSKGKDSPEYQKALATKEFFQEQLQNPNTKVIEQLYTQDYMNKKYDADALGDIFRVDNTSTDFTFRDIPQSGSGSGSGDFSLDGLGRAAATTKELVSTDLHGIKGNATNKMLGDIKANNNLAGGKARAIVMGEKGSNFRRQMEAHPAKAYARQEQMLAIFRESKSAKDFYNKLKQSGFNSGNTLENATAVFNSLSSGNTAQSFSNRLQSMENDYNDYITADDQLRNANNAAFADKSSLPEFKRTVLALDDSKDKQFVSAAAVAKLAAKWGKTVKQLIDSGVVSHVAAQGNQGGTITPESWGMSAGNIAQAYGYKSVKEAVQDGFNFSRAGADYVQGVIDKSRDESFRKNYQGNEMGFRLVGDEKVDKSLSNELLSISDLNSFMPVGGKSWNNVPGFNEQGKLLPGTTLLEGKAPKLVTQGNQVFLEIPYKYKDEDGKSMETSVKVRAKPEERVYFSEILRKVALDNYQIKDDNAAAAQNFDTFTVALFNNETQSKLTRQAADNAEVSSTNRYVVLERVSAGRGATVQIRKEFQGEDARPIYTAYIVDVKGGIKDAGIKSYDVDGVKSKLAEQLYLK
jgi:hypothetical protein